jgi:DNA-binding MarR family transcriptional regulator
MAAEIVRPLPMPAARKTAPVRKKPAADTELLERFDFQKDSLGYAIRRAQMRAYALFFDSLGELGLSPARVTALSLVAMDPALNQAQLARKLDIAGPSALKLVDALEGAGFIRREDVAGDRRRYSLVLTAAGRRALEQVREALDAYEARLARQLDAAERRQLMALLARVAT